MQCETPSHRPGRGFSSCQVSPKTRPGRRYQTPATHLCLGCERIPSTTPGAEPPRDARDSGSPRSHSTHLETSSSDRPKMVTYMGPLTVPSDMSVTCTRRTLRMPNFTRAPLTQLSLIIFPSGTQILASRPTHAGRHGGNKSFPLPPKIKIPNSHIV